MPTPLPVPWQGQLQLRQLWQRLPLCLPPTVFYFQKGVRCRASCACAGTGDSKGGGSRVS